MRGVKQHRTKVGVSFCAYLLIMLPLLRRLREVWEASRAERDTKQILAVCCLCSLGFLRAREMTVSSNSSFNPTDSSGCRRHCGRQDCPWCVCPLSNPRPIFLDGHRLMPVAVLLACHAVDGSPRKPVPPKRPWQP